MAKKEPRASDTPVCLERRKHLKPFEKKKTSKRRRRAGKKRIEAARKEL